MIGCGSPRTRLIVDFAVDLVGGAGVVSDVGISVSLPIGPAVARLTATPQ